MCMDITTKHFGPRASNKISLLAAAINLLTCLIFFIASSIPSNADDYTAFNSIFGGTWFILLGSTIAFLTSAVLNNMLNWMIGNWLVGKFSDRFVYNVQTYVSTFIGQFFDNFLFSIIVFVFFAPIFWDGFHWSVLQCCTCALTGAFAELLMEILFSPIGYRIVTKWKINGVGKEYLEYLEKGRK